MRRARTLPVVELDDRLADEVTERLRATGASFALVFGSHARGEQRSGSDVDVAAWWPTEAPHAWEVDLPTGVDLIVLADLPLELAGRIALDGQVLFEDDPAARVEWVATTRKIWLDERYRWDRSHREYLEAVARGRGPRLT